MQIFFELFFIFCGKTLVVLVVCNASKENPTEGFRYTELETVLPFPGRIARASHAGF
jgi:hypothetical protein